MTVHLVALNTGELLHLLQQRAALEQHILTEDPARADLILFVGSFSSDPNLVLKHPLYRDSPDRCAVYTEDDNYLPLLPGVYCSARADHHSRAGRTFSYSYVSRNGQYSNNFIAASEHSASPDKTLLFSFQGGSTSMLRKRMFNLTFNRTDALIENTSTYYHWDLTQPGRVERQQQYAKTLAASQFVLCPRGAGSGSIRLFEVMSAGIAPVLISDDYLLPPGPDWDAFLLRVKEADIARIPDILEPHTPSAGERGRLARKAWVQFFSPEREFDAIVAHCQAALHHAPPTEATFRKEQSRIIARDRRRRQLRSLARNTFLRVLRILHLKSPYQMNR